MKANPFTCALLLLLAVAGPLPAKMTAFVWEGCYPRDTNELAAITCVTTPDGFIIKVNFLKEGELKSTSTNETEIKTRAEKGDPTAQALLGFNLIMSGVLKYDAEARKIVRNTGGTNEAKQATEAAKWFRKAADQGRADAENDLGTCYAEGFGVETNRAEAAKWFLKAAEQGDADAQYSLGRAYENGEGVEMNIKEAMKCYRSAARQITSALERVRWAANNGDADAQSFLGESFYGGLIGVDVEMKAYPGVFKKEYHKNPTEAVKWLRRAAEQGNANAQNNLGVCYENGEGVPMDYVEAYKWLNLAAAQGESLTEIAATMMRDELAKEMTPDQIAEAQRLARGFKPRKESKSGDTSSRANPTASGTGFFISEDGFLVTNEHVVREAAQVRLVTSAGLISAKVVKVDAANDLALLKAVGIPNAPLSFVPDHGVVMKFPPLPVASSRSVKLGATVATVGFPNIGLQGFAPKLAKGEIASLSGAGDDARYFQISVPVQPGNSGGALVDERGNVVGVVSAKLSARAALAASGALPENVNYAVKSSFLLGFLESVPEVSAKLAEPRTAERKFEEVVKDAEQAAVLVLVY